MLELRPTTSPRRRLLAPTLGANVPVGAALRARSTTRAISDRPLDEQLLSNLLFAAGGVNRRPGPFSGLGRTAASASNSQEVLLYVALAEGAFRYEPDEHALVSVALEDVRRLALGPHQPPLSPDAPVQLVFVVDIHRLEHTSGFEEPGLHDPEVQKSYYFVDTGLIAGNVYLFAAAEGLACWFHNCDRLRLAEKLALPPNQRVLFAETVGYPALG